VADETFGRAAGAAGDGDRPDVRDLLPAYALDAVDDVERRAVERLLETDADARRELDEYRDVVAAFAVETAPPPGLRDVVLARVAGTPRERSDVPSPSEAASAVDAGPVVDAGPAAVTGAAAPAGDGAAVVDLAAARRARRRRWTGLAAAVAAVLAVAVPTTVAVRATQEQSRLQEQVDTIAQMLADPEATILRGDVTGGGHASVLAAGDDMYFRATDLPGAGDDRDYQLWVVAADGEVASAGVLDVHDGSTTRLVQDAPGIGMAVTLEPAGGSPQPTSDPIVALVG
jgi:anti-sigma-K factor RskA